MAKTYTSTIELNCWKEHICGCCGSAYSYEFKRRLSGRANTAEKASINAQAAVARALAHETDMQPCPTCGTFQPDMIGQQRARAHKRTFWLALIAFGIILGL